MKWFRVALLVAIFSVLLSTGLNAQDKIDEETKNRIIERVKSILDESLKKLREEIKQIVKEEIEKTTKGIETPPPPPKEKKPYLGIEDGDFTDKEREKLGLEKGVGLKIGALIKDGPAEKAGFKVDDIILEIGGKKVTEKTMEEIMKGLKPGDEVEVKVLRNKEEQTIKLTIGEKPEKK